MNLIARYTPPGLRFLWFVILGSGVLLRLGAYLANRSLWLDEAMLALNVLGKPMAGLLFKPLDFNQAAPPGFLFLTKLVVGAIGDSEYALRLVPLLFSLLSLGLLAWVVVRLLASGPALIAMALFAFHPQLIRYAAESKQYGVDVAVGLGVIAAVLPFLIGPTSIRHAVVLSLAGIVAVWLSHPAPFVLAAAGGALLLHGRLTGQPSFRIVLAVGAFWILSFAAVYVLSLRALAAHQSLREAWAGAFAPPVVSPAVVGWLGQQVRGLFAYAFGGQSESVGVLAVLIGTISLLRYRPAQMVLFAGPAGVALAAALLGRYPFQDRLTLFALPQLTLLAGAGIEHIGGGRSGRLVVIVLTVLLLFMPVYRGVSQLIRPSGFEEVRPAIAHIQRISRPDDTVYLYPPTQYAFRYYAPRLGFHPRDVVVGRYATRESKDIAKDLQQLRGRGRVWVLLSHFPPDRGQFIQYYLDTLGSRRDSFAAAGALVMLYDLR